MRHVPNILTGLRLLAVPFTIWLMVTGSMVGAFWLFAAAGLTDALDGAIARLFNAQTRLGQLLDPLADKVLLVAIVVTLTIFGYLPLWLAVLVALRDVVIVLYAMMYVLAGSFDGTPLLISKINTAAQLLLAAAVLARLGPGWGNEGLTDVLVIVVAVTTIASGCAYLFSVSRRVPADNGGG
jgi:cardiolipin synthase (CMP-forming)